MPKHTITFIDDARLGFMSRIKEAKKSQGYCNTSQVVNIENGQSYGLSLCVGYYNKDAKDFSLISIVSCVGAFAVKQGGYSIVNGNFVEFYFPFKERVFSFKLFKFVMQLKSEIFKIQSTMEVEVIFENS